LKSYETLVVDYNSPKFELFRSVHPTNSVQQSGRKR
jgi:hypothetical protein